MSTRSLLVCGLILVSIQLVFGHGFLQLPISRNYAARLAGKEYCHHCLSSGGPYTVQSLTPGGKFPTPTESVTSAVRHTICGESAAVPASARVYNPFPAPAVSGLPAYTPGQVIDIEVVITAHHRGHFDFRLCDASKLADPSTVNWACMTTLLQRVSVPGEVSPVDVNHPERYYLEPECSPNYNKTITMKYQLPSNLTCERCIMQWWWVSANTCNPPDYAQRTPQPAHVATGCDWWQSNLPLCGQSYPEEFFNCADIRIAGGAATPGTNTAPPPAQPVAAPVAAPAVPVAAPAVPKATPAVPKAAPAVPKAPPAAPKAAPAVPKAAPAVPKATPTTAPKAPASPPKPPTAPINLSCAILGGQCGGNGWTGPTCCQSGTCYKYLATYSQCRAGSCPSGWICTGSKNQSTLASAVAWAQRFFA